MVEGLAVAQKRGKGKRRYVKKVKGKREKERKEERREEGKVGMGDSDPDEDQGQAPSLSFASSSLCLSPLYLILPPSIPPYPNPLGFAHLYLVYIKMLYLMWGSQDN